MHRALRLSPDEWMIPLFGDPDADDRRDVLEGRMISLALAGPAGSGSAWCWTSASGPRDERTALRALAEKAGARCELVYLDDRGGHATRPGSRADAPRTRRRVPDLRRGPRSVAVAVRAAGCGRAQRNGAARSAAARVRRAGRTGPATAGPRSNPRRAAPVRRDGGRCRSGRCRRSSPGSPECGPQLGHRRRIGSVAELHRHPGQQAPRPVRGQTSDRPPRPRPPASTAG